MPPKRKRSGPPASNRPKRRRRPPTRFVPDQVEPEQEAVEAVAEPANMAEPEQGAVEAMVREPAGEPAVEHPGLHEQVVTIVKDQMASLVASLPQLIRDATSTQHSDSVSGQSGELGQLAVPIIQPVASAILNTSGNASLPPLYMGQNYLSLSARVPHKLKEKIWAHEFIDLGQLLEPDFEPSYQLSLSKDDGSISVISKNRKQISLISQWDKAFSSFVSVYVQKNPKEFVDLLQYSNLIKSMHHQGGNWRKYDEAFRQHRAITRCPWHTTLLDEWVFAMQDKPSQPHNNFRRPGPRPENQQSPVVNDHSPRFKYTPGLCFRFNDGFACSSKCIFKHVCDGCGGAHPKVKCSDSSCGSVEV
jgi:hypothetical protein